LDLAVGTYPKDQRKALFLNGIRALDVHRKNYTATHPEPKELQLLWWEFPKEHWDELREGGSMNFLHPPQPGIHPNGPMDEEMTAAAVDFLDELISLKVLVEREEVTTTAPMFVVPKEGQPGQWRVIANLKEGGQNAAVASDPVYLNRTSHILEQMYEGGFSAVVDASKFFYQFKTQAADQQYLGVVHPTTGKYYVYAGLPMGAGNSPSLAGKFGLSFVRLLKEKFDIFQGTPRANTWWKGFEENGYDPKLGHGFVLIGKDGHPTVKIWVHVDDFLIHGPTLEATQLALRHFLDTAVDCGLLCHPGKLTPPQQRVKYCGYLIDTTQVPTLLIPTTKRERALAMVELVLAGGIQQSHSRLSLSVVAGVLESLVEVTPRRLGRTYLRRLHSIVNPGGLGTGAAPFYTKGSLDRETLKDLIWWRKILLSSVGRVARTGKSATLIPTWGDGSGTGTGGTLGIPDAPLEMWMRQWSPCIFSYSSNWKELKTLHLTMLRMQDQYLLEARGTTIFYFTDNFVTYCIVSSGASSSPELHFLIEQIRLLELDLNCTLVAVHVPGRVMIEQGTDALSRGVWVSPFHHAIHHREINTAVFAPLDFDPRLVDSLINRFQLPEPHWIHYSWTRPWEATKVFDICTVWFPPPEVARQALIFVLESWVERPLTTSAIFVVPRTLSGMWRGLSRHLQELCLIQATEWDFLPPLLLPIPVMAIYLPRHIRRLTPTLSSELRLDPTPLPSDATWHRQQAAHMRGLSPRHITEPLDPSMPFR